ncbi:AzlD domain-containing protein [Desulfovibrio aerotolerans]|uniref:AzlD domain-containing protein n=1 Tax=Solidesulfovibrio aerotolerans TaxID=295255 RepID=A0A7C9INL9_9BACT|nr:AzlD domain-containing protein [Solidesulfovibrio aerotolerans]MYL83279.1 AzlD domain-containing protein [Solidesulfovibrio aerotolerans]
MDDATTFVTIAGMAAVTYATRSGPLLFLAGRTLAPSAIRFLAHVPAAVLAALAAPALLRPQGQFDMSLDNAILWAGLAAFALALRTKGFFGPVALGMGLVAAVRFLSGA